MRFAITVQSRLSRRASIVCDFLISFFATISVEQWRYLPLAFFAHGSWVAGKYVNDESLREIRRDNVNCEKCTCNDLK